MLEHADMWYGLVVESMIWDCGSGAVLIDGLSDDAEDVQGIIELG